jgi:hypothetical protein
LLNPNPFAFGIVAIYAWVLFFFFFKVYAADACGLIQANCNSFKNPIGAVHW